MKQNVQDRFKQRGIVLISSILLLLVVTIMALSIFRSFGMQEKIAGNTREKQRALQAAVGVEDYAEWWIANGSTVPLAIAAGTPSTATIACNAVIDANVNPTQVPVCSNTMASLGMTPATVPWNTASVKYAPTTMNIVTTANNPNVIDTYPAKPEFYITDKGPSATGVGELYQIDAYSYGLTQATVSVVESTVTVVCGTCNKEGL